MRKHGIDALNELLTDELAGEEIRRACRIALTELFTTREEHRLALVAREVIDRLTVLMAIFNRDRPG